MGEKRGMTVQLEFDFRTEGVCEVLLPSGNWYRTSAREFRSFDGPRRLTYISGPSILGKPYDEELSTIDYVGPLYLYNTNKLVEFTNSQKFIWSI
jgi:hypothetical protein